MAAVFTPSESEHDKGAKQNLALFNTCISQLGEVKFWNYFISICSVRSQSYLKLRIYFRANQTKKLNYFCSNFNKLFLGHYHCGLLSLLSPFGAECRFSCCTSHSTLVAPFSSCTYICFALILCSAASHVGKNYSKLDNSAKFNYSI